MTAVVKSDVVAVEVVLNWMERQPDGVALAIAERLQQGLMVSPGESYVEGDLTLFPVHVWLSAEAKDVARRWGYPMLGIWRPGPCRCGNPVQKGCQYCPDCRLTRGRESRRELRARRMDEGLCSRCGKQPLYSKTECIDCNGRER